MSNSLATNIRKPQGRLGARLVLLGLLLLVFGLGLVLAAPFVLERIIVSQMRQLGIEQPQVTVQALRPGRISLSSLAGENLGLEVQSVNLHFSLQGLMQGRADMLEIRGLEWRLGWKGARLDPGLPFVQGRQSGSDKALVLPPVQEIQLRSSYLLWEHSGLSWPQPFSGDISMQEDQGQLQARLKSSLLGIPLQLEGQADLEQGRFRLQGRVPGAGKPEVRGTKGSSSLRAGMDFGWEQELQGAGQGGLQGALQAADLSWPGRDLGLEELYLSLQAEMDQDLELQGLEADLHLKSLRIEEYLLSSLELELKETGSELSLDVALQEPAELQLALQGRQTDFWELLQRPLAWQGSFEYQLQGKAPRELVNRAADNSVLESNALPFQSAGKLKGKVERSSGDWSWQGELQAKKNFLGPADLAWPDSGLSLEGFYFRAPLQGKLQEQRLQARLGGEGTLGIETGKLAAEGKAYQLQGLQLSSQSGPWVEYILYPEGKQEVLLDLSLAEVVSLQGPDIMASLSGLKLKGDLLLAEAQDWQGVLRAGLEQGSLQLPEQDLALESITAELPLVLGRVGHQPGRFHVGRIKAQGAELPGPGGTVLFKNQELQLQGIWQVLPEILLQLDMDLALEDKGLEGSCRVFSDWFALPEPEELQRFSPLLQDLDLEFSGLARLDMRAELQGQDIEPYLQLELREAEINETKQDLQLQGLVATVALDSLAPLQTARGQGIDLEFSKLRWQELELQEGDLELRLLQDRLYLDSGSCSLQSEGEIRVHEGSWDLGKQQGEARIYLQEIDALGLVQDFTQGKLVGSGLFSGSFALGWDSQGASLGGGHLYALPGTGRLGIQDEEWLEKLLYYVRQSMEGQEYLSLLSQRLEQALREFEYNFFSFRLLPQEDEVAGRIELRGQGVRGDPPQKVGSLVLNISNVEQALNQALKLGREKAVRKALDELFGSEP
ncbi:MAG: intermembrane phospholipid transport protein YdbH family protein [Desulfohalobiaceae bacterium]